MELTITKAELNRALQMTQNMVARKTTMPILVNVLLSASEGTLKISASDLEVTGVATCKAQVRSIGSTTVNAKVLTDIIRELPDGDVHLKLGEGERLELKTKQSSFRMVGVSAEEYPTLPGVSFEVKGRINSKQLLEMIEKTIYASSMDETRFNLNGVCFEMVTEGSGKNAKKSLRLVAVDGFRLAMVTRPVTDLDFSGRVIAPRRGLLELIRILAAESEREIAIGIEEGFLVVHTEGARVAMRLIDGEFPNYNQVLPKEISAAEGRAMALISSEVFAQALRRVALMVTDKAKSVRLDFSSERLHMSSSSPEIGEANEEVAIKYEGKPISIGFNAVYLLDITSSLGEGQPLRIDLHGELGPGRFIPESDASYVSVIMPMRL